MRLNRDSDAPHDLNRLLDRPAQPARFAAGNQKIPEATHEAIGAKPESVRVILTEMPKEHFGIGGKSAVELGR